MPELPNIELYLEALRERIVGHPLDRMRTLTPFVLRSVRPAISDIEGRIVTCFRRIGKRIVFEFEGGYFLVIHLMIAGRLSWQEEPFTIARPGGKDGLAVLGFPTGFLLLTEAGSKKRASIYVVEGEADLARHDPGGIDPLTCTLTEFTEMLTTTRRTLKRALTDPRSFSGIGNAYSDEILHTAKISPIRHTTTLDADELARLHLACRDCLIAWTDKLRAERKGKFPKRSDVTAFRPDFAVHGKYGKPCPVCGKPVQRIQYADNETNYCARCQNGDRILADRSLSRLLKDDWPRDIDEIEVRP